MRFSQLDLVCRQHFGRTRSDSASNETFYSFVAAERLSKPATPPKTSHKHIPTHLHIPNRPTSHLICFEFNVVASTLFKMSEEKELTDPSAVTPSTLNQAKGDKATPTPDDEATSKQNLNQEQAANVGEEGEKKQEEQQEKTEEEENGDDDDDDDEDDEPVKYRYTLKHEDGSSEIIEEEWINNDFYLSDEQIHKILNH